MTTPGGWYPDPSGSGMLRFFDGHRWTDRFAKNPSPPPAPPTSTAPPALSAGWYPDPDRQQRRRYWDGQEWTAHYTAPEISTPGFPRPLAVTLILVGIVGGLAAVAKVAEITQHGNVSAIQLFLGGLFVVALAAPFAYGLWFAFRFDRRRRERQQRYDREKGLAINADVEDDAYARGDDDRGIYGQFPPAT